MATKRQVFWGVVFITMYIKAIEGASSNIDIVLMYIAMIIFAIHTVCKITFTFDKDKD